MEPTKKSFQEILSAQNEQLKSQLMATSLINEITKVMMSTPDLDHVFRTIILGIHETIGFDRVALLEVNKDHFCLRPKIWAGIEDEKIKNLEIPLGFMGGPAADAVFLYRHLIVDVVDEDVDPVAVLGTKSYLVIPLITKITQSLQNRQDSINNSFAPYESFVLKSNEPEREVTEDDRRQAFMKTEQFRCMGILLMDRPDSKVLVTSDEMTPLTTLASQAGIIIDNFEMYHAVEKANKNLKEINEQLAVVNNDLTKAHAKINKDLDRARVIQTGLLPTEFKDTENMKVGARYLPADQVGGDYYDFFRIDQDHYGMVVADVSGHGVASALIMAMTKVLLKTFSQKIRSPQETLERINDIFQTDIQTDNFVTVFFGIFNIKEKKLHFVSAGHNPIIFIDKKSNNLDTIKADGLFLGVFEDMMLSESSRDVVSGNRIVLYTDGLTEAESPGGDMYNLARLCDISKDLSHLDPDAFIDRVFEDLRNFTAGSPLQDDVTMLVIDF